MHKEVLKELGFSDDVLESLEKTYQEGEDKPNIQELAGTYRDSIKSSYLESEDFQTRLADEKKAINTQAWNALTGSMSGKAAKYGIEKDELSDLKPIEIVERAYDAGTKTSNKGVEEHQQAAIAANKRIEELQKEHEEAIKSNDEKWKGEISTDKINTLALQLAASRTDTIPMDAKQKVIVALAGIQGKGINVGYNFENKKVEVSLPNGGKPQNETGTETLGFDALFNLEMDKFKQNNGGKPADRGVKDTHNPGSNNGEYTDPATLEMKKRFENKFATPTE